MRLPTIEWLLCAKYFILILLFIPLKTTTKLPGGGIIPF
jgi:hypothetical protein